MVGPIELIAPFDFPTLRRARHFLPAIGVGVDKGRPACQPVRHGELDYYTKCENELTGNTAKELARLRCVALVIAGGIRQIVAFAKEGRSAIQVEAWELSDVQS